MSTSTPKKAAAPAAEGPGLVMKAWIYLGISRSTFFRMSAAGGGPRPVNLPGSRRPYYRRADLDRWLQGLKPARGRGRPTCAPASDPVDGQAGDGPTAA